MSFNKVSEIELNGSCNALPRSNDLNPVQSTNKSASCSPLSVKTFDMLLSCILTSCTVARMCLPLNFDLQKRANLTASK